MFVNIFLRKFFRIFFKSIDFWEEIEYITITFDTDGGTEIEELELEKYSKLIAVETPIKEGYIFVEWQLDGVKYDLDTPIENNITIKAIYELAE